MENKTKTAVLDLAVARDDDEGHICATCRNKERVYISTADGSQHAAIWRCRELSERFRREVLVQPEGSCFENRSLSDYYEPQEENHYVW